MIRYALFDFDGTLIDSNEAVVSMLHLVSERHRGVGFSAAELNEIIGKPIADQMAFLSVEKRDELVELYRAEYRKVRDELTKAYDGVEALLKRLKAAGIKIGIVSNKGRNGIDHGLELLNLSEYIDISISKDDVVNSKPDPEGIYRALDGLGVGRDALAETVFVGDSGHDIECGKRAGCKTILVEWTLIDMAQLMLLEPDFVAKTPEDIAEFIEANALS